MEIDHQVMRCGLAQGYFMGEPTPSSGVEAVLAARSALADGASAATGASTSPSAPGSSLPG